MRMATSASACTRLEGKVAVITASTDGIGYAIAKRLGEEGAHVVISSRKQANVDRALRKLRALNISVEGMVCHAGKAEERIKLIEMASRRNGGFDILVSNAGVNPSIGKMLDCEEDAWDKIFDLNVKAAYLLVKESVPRMVNRGGSIIFISSLAAYMPVPARKMIGHYAVSKNALVGLSKALAPQLADMNIRVNCVAPGLIDTGFMSRLIDTPECRKFEADILLKRHGRPGDISGVVAFLASEDASYITGETIAVGGGYPSRL